MTVSPSNPPPFITPKPPISKRSIVAILLTGIAFGLAAGYGVAMWQDTTRLVVMDAKQAEFYAKQQAREKQREQMVKGTLGKGLGSDFRALREHYATQPPPPCTARTAKLIGCTQNVFDD